MMMTERLEVKAEADFVREIEDAAEDLDLSQDETIRQLIALGMMDYEMLGDDILAVTDG